MRRDLLLEIGVEEIPPKESPHLAKQLRSAAEEVLKAYRLDHETAAVYYTPRRLTLYVKGLDEEQRESTEEVRGPPREVGLDDAGNPTEAALGFARRQGVEPGELKVMETAKGEYLCAHKTIPGRPTGEVLREALPQTIDALAPSETMRWDNSGRRFIRPMRWILCMYGEETIPFEFGRLRAGRITSGHRFLGSKNIPVDSSLDYFEKLQANGVVLDQLERRERIDEALKEISQQIKARPVVSEELRGQIADNLEHPSPVLGEFPEDYLRLPREILETTLLEHQKFVPFAVGDKASPHFVGFRDGPEDHDQIVRRGYQRVVRARLDDSAFFFDEDRKRPLADRVPELDRVTYQEQLGTIGDKVKRMRAIAARLAERLNLEPHREEIDRAATLCKTDLLTEMVHEFPNLEGVMGGIYADLDGEPESVSRGIYEHYLPKSARDPIPESPIGIVISLADKTDTVIGSLLIGEEPTGSRDPFGLRRKANGVVRIALERQLDLDLLSFAAELKDLYAFLNDIGSFQPVSKFFVDRFAHALRDDYEIAHDVTKAVTASGEGNLHRALHKARALTEIRGEEPFQSLVLAFTRVSNIVSEQRTHGYEPRHFEDEAEKALWRAVLKAEGQIEQLEKEADYAGIIERLIELRGPIDRYFDEVLVMAEDPRVRQNRLGFLSSIESLFFTIGDLSQIVVEGESDLSKTRIRSDADRSG